MDLHSQRSGARLLVEALAANRVDRIFCVPGESYLPVLDALYDVRGPHRRSIVCRQEGGAANMAEAYGKLTGRPGICFVTRGPGATNASVGMHTAFQDSTPMILFIGQVGRGIVRPRGVPGNRLPADVRPGRQMGGADRRRRRASRNMSAAPSPSRCPAGPARSCSRCRRTC